MKRIAATVLILVFLIMAVPISAFASLIPTSLYDAVLEGIKNHDDNVSVALFSPTQEEIVSVMTDIIFNEPEVFYLSLEYRIGTVGSSVVSLLPQYKLSGTEYEAAKVFVEEQLDAIIATVPDGLDDAEKALYLHDYICLNFEYDTTYSIYDIYNLLKSGTGVCQAYSLLYDALLTRVGIDSRAVTTEDHMWNQVNLGSKWYHVDVTWDDPISDLFGRARHDHFLVSDDAVAASHFNENTISFDAKYISNDTSFDNLFWHDQATPFGFVNGDIYCLDDNVISRMDLYTAEHAYVYTINDKWHSSQGTYIDCLSGFGSYNNMLIFNSDKEIKYLDPTTLETGSAAMPVLPDSNYIYRMYVKGNTAVYMYDTIYSRTGTVDSVELVFGSAGPEVHVHDDGEWTTLDDGSKELRCTECGELLDSEPAHEQPPVVILLGDVNNDGSVDMFDYLMVKSFYFEVTTPTDDQFIRADMNQDGVIDMFDYLLVKSAYFNS